VSLRSRQGFTLIEVAIALAILAVVLVSLLEVQATSLNNASRARGLTIATILARSKMIDIEKKLFDEGFIVGEDTEEGDFEEEGHKDYTWKYRVVEVEIDLSSLSSMCGGFGEEVEEGSTAECESLLSGFGGPFESLTDELSRSLRVIEITVTWPDGKYSESITLRALATREDFNLQPLESGGNMPFPGEK
jgi:general secretion pathway protein I